MEDEQAALQSYGERFVVCKNRPENDEHWDSEVPFLGRLLDQQLGPPGLSQWIPMEWSFWGQIHRRGWNDFLLLSALLGKTSTKKRACTKCWNYWNWRL
jgi:hypothetical protein